MPTTSFSCYLCGFWFHRGRTDSDSTTSSSSTSSLSSSSGFTEVPFEAGFSAAPSVVSGSTSTATASHNCANANTRGQQQQQQQPASTWNQQYMPPEMPQVPPALARYVVPPALARYVVPPPQSEEQQQPRRVTPANYSARET